MIPRASGRERTVPPRRTGRGEPGVGGPALASDTEAGRVLAARVTPYLIDALDEMIGRASVEWR